MALGGAKERLEGSVAAGRLVLDGEGRVGNFVDSRARSAFGSVVISPYPAAPRATADQTWRARKAGVAASTSSLRETTSWICRPVMRPFAPGRPTMTRPE